MGLDLIENMGQSKIEKRAEVAKHSFDSLQRIALGFMPGSHVIDEFLNFRGNLKQKRLLDFIDSLKSALENISEIEISGDNFTTEEFVDVFEAVIGKVLITKSVFKKEKFRNLLVNQIIDPITDDLLLLKFVEYLDNLNEVQIIILQKMCLRSSFENVVFEELINSKDRYQSSLDDYYKTVHVQVADKALIIPRDDVQFYVNDLISKGLIIKKVEETSYTEFQLGGSGINKEVKDTFKISDVGKRFMEFIEME